VGLYEGNLKEAIHKFKFNNGRRLGKLFAEMALKSMVSQADFLNVDWITFVPLTRRKEAKRGYNQAQIFAHEVAGMTDKSLFRVLVKKRETQDQNTLDLKDRADNVRGAFALRSGVDVSGKAILLADDVFTTGHTVNECCRVLLAAGARKVNVLTIARATMKV